MRTLKISTRLAWLVGLLSLLALGLAAAGQWGLTRANAALHSVYLNRTVPAAKLGDLRVLDLGNRLHASIALDTPTPALMLERADRIVANLGAAERLWQAYLATDMTAEERGLAARAQGARSELVDQGITLLLEALRRGDAVRAQALLTDRVHPLGDRADEAVDALSELQVRTAAQAFADGTQRATTTRTLGSVAAVLGLGAALVFGTLTARSILRELGAEPAEAARVARSVAAGDLSLEIPLRSGDRHSLMAQLKTMQDGLAGVVRGVRQNAEGVATASTQIAQGNSHLSGRTERQASALQQTAASMQQLGVAVAQNAEHAQAASALAQHACAVAVQGGQAVGRVLQTMQQIDAASRRIGDIIATVDGIAFQTNILALNAAVEAARAGEQGRGFAVVAGEVRALAGKSAVAAHEIRDLVQASGERVAQGSAQASDAGQTMDRVVAAIHDLERLVGQISSASSAQRVGVGEVGDAVDRMDRATQQNAALVEQSAAAADSLSRQAQRLLQSVAVFRLDAAG